MDGMIQGSKEEQYLQGRWQSQKDYYSKQTKIYKLWHQIFLLISTIGALFVPVLLSFSQVPKLLPVIISLMVSSALALDNAFHFGDNWRSFRETIEALKRERVFFDMGIEPYADPQTAFQLFVQKNETIMGKEGEGYFEAYKPMERIARDNPNS
jgi:hypothetical protein